MTSPASADWLRRRLVARFWCDRIRERLAAKPTKAVEPQQLTLPFIWSPKQWK